MTILSRVCAEFHAPSLDKPFRIDRKDRMVILSNVPDAIQQDPMFAWLVKDGSIDVIESVTDKKRAELDPAAGTSADGKKLTAQDAEKKAQKGRKPASVKKGEETSAQQSEATAAAKNEGNEAQ